MTKKYQDFLLESFDSKPAKWFRIRFDDNGLTDYTFSINDLHYYVNIQKSHFSENKYTLGFLLDNNDEIIGDGVSNTGNQYKVFVTVIDCLKDFLKKMEKQGNPVYKIYFSAAKFKDIRTGKVSSRPKVYERLIKRNLPSNYSYYKLMPLEKNALSTATYNNDYEQFIIVRTDLPKRN